MSEQSRSKSYKGRKRNIRYNLVDEPTGVVFGGLNCTALSRATPPGTTIQFSDRGAQKLRNVNVVLIFWGREWVDQRLANLVTNAVQNLLAGPYMSYLAQYGVRRGSLWGVIFATAGDPPTPLPTRMSATLSSVN